MWTAGVGFFQKENGKHAIKKLLKNPCIDAVMIGLILMVTQFRLPVALDRAVTAFSKCNTGMSMFLIGMVASKIKLRDPDRFVELSRSAHK
uniref:AEC family transporter n=1 Tax=Enterocloster clostridioformis TaxID=1531 RepID=UPI0026EB436A|nr:AEC family transporter [Enterocloster clostridioformis]